MISFKYISHIALSMDSYRYIFVIHLVGQKISIFNLILFFHSPSIDIDHIIIGSILRCPRPPPTYGRDLLLQLISPPHLSLSIVVVFTTKLICSTTYLIVGKNPTFLVVKSIFPYLYSYLFGRSPSRLLSTTNSRSPPLTPLSHPQ